MANARKDAGEVVAADNPPPDVEFQSVDQVMQHDPSSQPPADRRRTSPEPFTNDSANLHKPPHLNATDLTDSAQPIDVGEDLAQQLQDLLDNASFEAVDAGVSEENSDTGERPASSPAPMAAVAMGTDATPPPAERIDDADDELAEVATVDRVLDAQPSPTLPLDTFATPQAVAAAAPTPEIVLPVPDANIFDGDGDEGDDPDGFETVGQVLGTEPVTAEADREVDADAAPPSSISHQRPTPVDTDEAAGDDAATFESADHVIHGPASPKPGPHLTSPLAPPQGGHDQNNVPVVQSLAELDALLAQEAEADVAELDGFASMPEDDAYLDAEDLYAGGFDTVGDVLDDRTPTPAHVTPPPTPTLSEANRLGPVPPPATPPQPAQPTVEAPAAPPTPPPAKASITREGHTASLHRTLVAAAPVAATLARRLAAVSHRAILAACTLVNKPLARLDADSRQTLGYVGIMFLLQGIAFALWAWWTR